MIINHSQQWSPLQLPYKISRLPWQWASKIAGWTMCFCMGLHVWLKYWMQLNYVLVLVIHMYLHYSASFVTRNCDCVALNLNWADLTWYLFFIYILNFPYISEFSRIIRYGCNVWHKNCCTQSLSEGWLLDVRCSTVEYQFSYPFFLTKPNFVKKKIYTIVFEVTYLTDVSFFASSLRKWI